METAGFSLKRARRAALLIFFPPLGGYSLDAALEARGTIFLDGRHNHGRWRCTAREFGATLNADLSRDSLLAAIALADRGGAGEPAAGVRWPSPPPRAQLRIPVAGFDCGNPKMERDLRRALRAREFPLIAFELRRVESARVLEPGRYLLVIEGALRIAGVERGEEIALLAQRTAPDRFRFTAALPARMSDFEIAPPVAFFGLIRAADELNISFDLSFTIASRD